MGCKHKGFTFLEVLAALAIVAIALVALLRLHLISIRTTERNDIQTRAGFLAQQKLAELMAKEYPLLGTKSGTLTQDGINLHWQTNVRPFDLAGYKQDESSALRKVCVDVRWKNGRQDKYFSLATIVADRKLP